MSHVVLRLAVENALDFLANRVNGSARYGARECRALLRHELIDLTEQLVASRLQVLQDRAELDAYRNRYGPIERERKRRVA